MFQKIELERFLDSKYATLLYFSKITNPEVGSSKHITVGFPIKAIDVDKRRLFPSDKSKSKKFLKNFLV